ncbi:hypothetical protein J4442_00315 [Candidatus Woesearchaeota archaeon]|nr:hypothetical protein [Candidatus Woesearchaeota archaeon]
MVQTIKEARTIKGNIKIKGAIKNGIDTSRLINLIVCFDSPENFKIKGFAFPPNLFYIHEVSFSEAVGILINNFKLEEKQAISKVKKWRDEAGTGEIKREKEDESYENLVKNTNDIIVKERGEKYKIGNLDIIIIAGFLRENINIVHARDKGFEETCKRLNINIIPTPKEEIKKEDSKRA